MAHVESVGIGAVGPAGVIGPAAVQGAKPTLPRATSNTTSYLKNGMIARFTLGLGLLPPTS